MGEEINTNAYELIFNPEKRTINLLEDIKLHKLPKIEVKRKKEKHINTKLRLKEGEITISNKVTMNISKIFELGRSLDRAIFEKEKKKNDNKIHVLNSKGIPLTHDTEFKIYKEDGKRMKNKTNHMKRRINVCSQRLSGHSTKLNENFKIISKSKFNNNISNLPFYSTQVEQHNESLNNETDCILVRFSPIVNVKTSHYKDRKLLSELLKSSDLYSKTNCDYKSCLNFALITNTNLVSMPTFKTLDQTNCIDTQCYVDVWKILDSESILISKNLFKKIVYFYRILLSFFIEAPRDWNDISISRFLSKEDFFKFYDNKDNLIYENYENERKYFLVPIYYNDENRKFEIDIEIIEEILKIHENAEFNFNVKKKDITCLTGLKYNESDNLNIEKKNLKSKIIETYKNKEAFFNNIINTEFNCESNLDNNISLDLNENKQIDCNKTINKSFLNVSKLDLSLINENKIKNFIQKTNYEKDYRKQNKPISYFYLLKRTRDLRKSAEDKLIKQMNKLETKENFCKMIDLDEDIDSDFDDITISSEDLKEFEFKFMFYSELMNVFNNKLVLNMEKLTVFNVEDILFPDDNSIDFFYKSKFNVLLSGKDIAK